MSLVLSSAVPFLPRLAQDAQASLQSLYEMVISGGPVMIPIGLCSIAALTYTVERAVRMAPGRLGGRGFSRKILTAVEEGGAAAGLSLCREQGTPLARVFHECFRRAPEGYLPMEKAVEDAGAREVARLQERLRPLVVVSSIAPLLGLLGTVWGLVQAFSKLASGGDLSKPELLASGVSQALITTVAGLVVAIPAQAIYYYFSGRIGRFAARVEDLYLQVADLLGAAPTPATATAGGSGAHP